MSAGTTKDSAAKDRASPTRTQKGTGAGRGRSAPDQQSNDRIHTYQRERLRSNGTEQSPSAGWRGVYAAMGVQVDGQR